jgi:hypothetical protein
MKHFEALYPAGSYSAPIEKIVNLLKQGHSCQLIGLPGVGKSNLLRLLAYNKAVRIKHFGQSQKFVHFVYMDFAEITNKSLLKVNEYIFLALADSLRDRDMEKEHKVVHKIFKEHLTENDELLLLQGLKEAINYLTNENKLSVVFLFDNFKNYLLNLDSLFFANLKILRNTAKYRFAAIFALNRAFEDTFGQEIFAQFYEFLIDKNVYLPITDKPSLEFRLDYLGKQSGKKIDEKIKKDILRLTGGHNNLTKLAFESLLSHEEKIGDLEEFLIPRPSIKPALFAIWNILTPAEQNLIQQAPISDNNIFLTNIELIKNGQINIPLLTQFVEKKLFLTSGGEKIVYDKTLNKIKKGSIVLSDNLTALEFKLLKSFLENEEKILEKDGIISAVWGDITSTAGVSDEALDQLIFRLRKKIEPDPTNPMHILSIKGRGFKFQA